MGKQSTTTAATPTTMPAVVGASSPANLLGAAAKTGASVPHRPTQMALKHHPQMALKHRRPPRLPSPPPTLTRTALLLAFLMALARLAELHIAIAMAELCRMAMAELCRMPRCSHRPPVKYPAAGTGHKMLKMWGGQATRKRWDQELTAFHGAQRSFMIDPVIDTSDLATLPHRIGHSSILQSCVA